MTHWNAVVKAFCYLKLTKNHGILHNRCDGAAKIEVTGFTDARNGTESVLGCSTSGVVYILAGGAIKWILEKKCGITLFEMESEFIASCKVAQSGLWIRDLLLDLGFYPGPANVWIDNFASMGIIINPESHKRALHIHR